MTKITQTHEAEFMDAPEQERISPATPEDEATLWLLLTFAASMGNGGLDEVENAKSDAYLSTYVKDWGKREGDIGVIARDTCGHPIGAAWLRLGHTKDKLRIRDQSIPELATGVIPQARGRGVGTRMLTCLIQLAAPMHERINLSVRTENPARRFYARLGFVDVYTMKNRVGGDSVVMTLDLRSSPQHQDSAIGLQAAH